MTKEDVIEILERFVLGAKPCSQKEIVDACVSAYRMLKEQPSLPSNLDEAEYAYADTIPAIEYPEFFNDEQLRDAFKAGAEWMSLQSTRARLAVKSNTPEGKDAYEKVAKEMRASVAAKDYGEGIYCPILKHKNKTGLNCTAVEDAFLKGAEWMTGQGETVEGVFKAGDPGYPDVRMGEQYSIEHILCKPGGIEPGDEVVVQIRKK